MHTLNRSLSTLLRQHLLHFKYFMRGLKRLLKWYNMFFFIIKRLIREYFLEYLWKLIEELILLSKVRAQIFKQPLYIHFIVPLDCSCMLHFLQVNMVTVFLLYDGGDNLQWIVNVELLLRINVIKYDVKERAYFFNNFLKVSSLFSFLPGFIQKSRHCTYWRISDTAQVAVSPSESLQGYADESLWLSYLSRGSCH